MYEDATVSPIILYAYAKRKVFFLWLRACAFYVSGMYVCVCTCHACIFGYHGTFLTTLQFIPMRLGLIDPASFWTRLAAKLLFPPASAS